MNTLKKYLLISFTLLTYSTIFYAQNTPCTGKGFITDADFFRVAATGSSMDMTTSQKKAMMKARTNITSEISNAALKAVDSQTGCDAQTKQKIKDLVLVAVRQEVSKMKVICQNSSNKSGKCEYLLVVEIAKISILNSVNATISSDKSLNGKFDSAVYAKALK